MTSMISNLLFLMLLMTMLAQAQIAKGSPTVYLDAIDGSAAAAINAELFVAASDEDSILRIYNRDGGGGPIQTIDLSNFLKVDAKSPETDIEGAARIGDRIYWITSHGRNKNGKKRPSRERFFATDIVKDKHGIHLDPVGKPYTELLRDLTTAPQLRSFDLKTAATRAPKDFGGLNIEGLVATPDNHLLIGFRNPIPQGRVLLIPLLNQDDVIEGKRPDLGTPVRLDLGTLGIRDIGLWIDKFIIIAGPTNGDGGFRLFQWAGGTSTPMPLKQSVPNNFRPESVIIYPDKGLQAFQLLSDDSSVPKNTVNSTPSIHKQFRSVWFTP
jgi:hypothetical protein